MIWERIVIDFISPLLGIESFERVLLALKENKVHTALCTGAVDGQKCHLAWALAAHTGRPLVFVTHSEAQARAAAKDLAFYAGESHVFPALDFLTDYVDVASKDTVRERIKILSQLSIINYQLSIPLVVSIEALVAPLFSPAEFNKGVLTLKVQYIVDLSSIAAKLVAMGYERATQVEGHGQFAIRGGILDVFSPLGEYPIRIELWGDEIDSIRYIDPITQRSLESALPEGVRIYPMCERGEGSVATLFDYFPENTIIVFDEVNRGHGRLEELFAEREMLLNDMLEDGRIDATQASQPAHDYTHITRAVAKFDVLLFNLMAQNVKDFSPTVIAHFDGKTAATFAGRIDLLVEDLQHLISQNYNIVITAGSRAARLKHELGELSVSSEHLLVINGEISSGFEYPQIQFAIMNFSEQALGVSGKPKKRRRLANRKGAPIDNFTDLNVGDYVVHDAQGIGIFRGIEKIAVDGAFRDYLKIGYRGESNLYIGIHQMDVLQKYIGGEGAKPTLSKLGSEGWSKAKAKAKAAVEEVAHELVELYAKRENNMGYAFEKDTVWQTEFEDSFIYEETDDQLAAVEDIKADMESPKVMDRLICGDVGYGKTEVAIRAAFKAVMEQKQVAFLCPTTILAQQHYNTVTQRMKDYPIHVQAISRFRTGKDTKLILEDVKNGRCDILIGTHRLLSGDVEFKNLGLIIVDEEQRFGVLHKEKLKQNWSDVDVITLTATPIPRTLHMSLAGIRDMSILNEPPQERQPIQTYVLEYSPEMVRSAITRELNRGGQVYYLHNRVQNIAATADKVQKLLPEAQVAFAHGQMSERELENTMIDFIDGEIDVLVCTTIIESGLDIPNVNTIIIQDADFLGLAQLYQLRGRVGRAGRSSFAYLMYQKDKILTEIAEKRLQTIREFTEFGAGFKIAMRDLEFRGAGNLLGTSQHGHMDAVGYEMYCKLLDLAVRELRGMELPKDFETLMDLSIDAFIPSTYIPHEPTRLEIYKKISHITDQTDFYDTQEELEDRFGTIPQPAANLLDIALLKAHAHAIDIISIKQSGGFVKLTFKHDANVEPAAIAAAVGTSGGRLKFNLSTNPTLTYRTTENEDVIPPLSALVLSLSTQ
ncbi:MAG: transcription-repair coupling factor [Defluviitaleaceae bacterium]|nr:transcription-repair coupling factor [Defluviitaleaceae bacterium]